MKIERIHDWTSDDHLIAYPLYKATYKHFTTYGTTHLQAFSNMLGIINALRWDNYKQANNLN